MGAQSLNAIRESTLYLGPERGQLVVQKRIRRARLCGALLIDRGFGLVALCSRRARLLSVFVAAGSWRLAISKEIRRRPGAGHRAQRVGVACIRAAALRDCVTVVMTPESTSPVLGSSAPNPQPVVGRWTRLIITCHVR